MTAMAAGAGVAGSTSYDAVVVGAGPAGLMAAATLAGHGVRVVVVDEGPTPGGRVRSQADGGEAGHASGREWVRALAREASLAGARIVSGASVFSVEPSWRVLLTPVDPANVALPFALTARALVVAVGAVERARALPGWTLPGVLSLGGAETLLHVHGLRPGRRVAIVGDDPLSRRLATALMAAGASVVGVAALAAAADEPPGPGRSAAIAADAVLPVALALHGSERVTGLRVRRADGGDALWAVDSVVVSAGQAPLTDVVELARAPLVYVEALGGFVPVTGPSLETAVPGLFVAGSATGVEGRAVAAAQGRLAATACAASLGAMAPTAAQGALAEARDMLAAVRAAAAATGLWPRAEEGRRAVAAAWRRLGGAR